MRRGGEGAVLNSRAEFNRSHIPRLQVEELDEEQRATQEQKDRDMLQRLLEEEEGATTKRIFAPYI